MIIEFQPNSILLSSPQQWRIQYKQDNEMYLSDAEFLNVCNETMEYCINNTISDLVEKGALQMSVGVDGEILYSNNKNYNWDKL